MGPWGRERGCRVSKYGYVGEKRGWVNTFMHFVKTSFINFPNLRYTPSKLEINNLISVLQNMKHSRDNSGVIFYLSS